MSSLQLGLRVGDHLALADFHFVDPSELAYVSAIGDNTVNCPGIIIIIIIII